MTLAEDAPRCFWAGTDPVNRHYHDAEWGRPVANDHRLFEKLCLEGFQSGLSWLTILKKRENFRTAFAGFDPEIVAKFGESDIERLLGDAGIVRHRGKIEAAINNAARALEAAGEFGSLAALVWRFEPPGSERPERLTGEALMQLAQTSASARLSKELKRRGWKFVGPTTCYAFMQAVGMVNDHTEDCALRAVIETERAAFVRPA
ncbi:MAG TPA: DNA-3-methyladenine glycosylase I [Devosiaceae bacterium]|nr:DNA-3-methyladenine glycosylase I [Devosiaceae bacterium]